LNYKIYTRLIGILFFIYLITIVDFNEIDDVWKRNSNLEYLIKSFLLIPFVILIKSYRWSLILSLNTKRLKFLDAYFIYFSSLSYGIISPGGVLGELTKILHLKNSININTNETAASVLLDRIFDLVVIYGIAVFCLSIFVFDNIILSCLLMLLSTLLPFYVLYKFLYKYLKKRINNNSKDKLKLIKRTIVDIFELLEIMKINIFIKTIIITLLGQFIAFVQVSYICKIMKLDFNIIYIFAINSFSTLISLIPITFAGIGSRDSLLLFLFSKKNITLENTLLFSTLYLFVFYFGTYFFSFLSLMIKPLKIK